MLNEENMLAQGWRFISCCPKELNIGFVLCSGQSFRWKECNGCWTGVHRGLVWQLQQDDKHLWYKVLNTETNADLNSIDSMEHNSSKTRKRKKKSQIKSSKVGKYEPSKIGNVDLNCNTIKEIDYEKSLRTYFSMEVDLQNLCRNWSKTDNHFAKVSSLIPGVRMLSQDPAENLFSFICSSNNNISRITGMVEKMCSEFGEKIQTVNNCHHFAFPTVKKLAESNTEEVLRKLGFGYRAKYIHQAAIQIHKNGGELWLQGLKEKPYEESHKELIKLPGIGAKVADCICMMSLHKPQAIPVDTHVWQIAVRDYKIPNLVNTKTLTQTGYKAIGDFFRTMWGHHASWAMNFLFVADLKQFKHLKEGSTCRH